MTNKEAAEVINGRFGAFEGADMCKKCDAVNEKECADCVNEAFDMATKALEKCDEIEEIIDACENCIEYQGIKEYPEYQAYDDIKVVMQNAD